jgi:DNA-binding NarL/FixJ family response regulator
MRTRVLIIDDDARFRALARALLEASGYTVVGEAADGEQALETARRLRPDAALLDVQLPDTDGFDVAEQLAALELPMEVILTSGLHLSDLGTLVADSSARGFIPKAELSVGAIDALLSEGAEPAHLT